MFWEDVEPVVTERLEVAVDEAYKTFANYPMRAPLIYCDCNVCMTPETARDLLSTPLKEIPQPLLAEYTNSAHGYDKELIEPQFKYFLPRYLDLIAQCKPPGHLDIETCLDRLGSADYRNSWPANEVQVVDEFFDAYVEASTFQLLLLEWPAGLRLEFDMGDVLVMVVRAGGDLDRVLEVLDKCADPEAAVHMASMRDDLVLRGGQHVHGSAFFKEYPTEAAKIGEWLLRDSVTDRILAASDQLESCYDDVLAMGLRA